MRLSEKEFKVFYKILVNICTDPHYTEVNAHVYTHTFFTIGFIFRATLFHSNFEQNV